ncbi:hypothetical protein DRN93_03845 [archaeon]|nr:MAG: hypothetical protein DRN93_03845 [archaeon]
MDAKLHSIGMPYNMCIPKKEKKFIPLFDKWFKERDRARIVFIPEPFSLITEEALRTLALEALERKIPVRYFHEVPDFINENWLYLFPFCDRSYIKTLMRICLSGSWAWCFSLLNMTPDDFPMPQYMTEVSLSEFQEQYYDLEGDDVIG